MLALYYLMKKSKKEKQSKKSATEHFNSIQKTSDQLWELRKHSLTKCRVCLQEGCLPIFGTEDTAYVVETLLLLSNVEVNEDDEYPKLLCDICHEFIKGAILFRKIARESEEILIRAVKEETANELANNAVDSNNDDNDKQYNQGTSIKSISDGSGYDAKQSENSEMDNDDSVDFVEVKPEKKVKIKNTSKVACNVCNKMISSTYYKEHLTMHDPNHKKFVCDVCGKSFRLRCAYHNHSLRHGKEFPFKCQFCPYKGKYSELLKNHMRTHTGDYKYVCTECPAKFLFKSNLNSHSLKHKEPRMRCDACNRAFHTKLLLQRHYEADHFGIKNHVCNICGKAFGYRNGMMKHQRHVHKREKLLFGRIPAYLEAQNRNEDDS